ncbi:MAG: type IV toxin-antitoxin system AbiEi family antitoxin domain-containing protein [Ardenticatenia bacterium]|nr:type IV toxin-antitoxin system AbiEi family antitoxin domain-containing protein [Ardenticatenia bacterium]
MLCGLDERTDFGLVGVQNPQRLQEEVAHLATDGMEPALRPTFTVDEIDGRVVVAQDGVGRWTTYRLLAGNSSEASGTSDAGPEEKVLSLARSQGSVSSGDCQAELGLNKDQTYRLLSNLAKSGLLMPVGHGRWRRYTLP